MTSTSLEPAPFRLFSQPPPAPTPDPQSRVCESVCEGEGQCWWRREGGGGVGGGGGGEGRGLTQVSSSSSSFTRRPPETPKPLNPAMAAAAPLLDPAGIRSRVWMRVSTPAGRRALPLTAAAAPLPRTPLRNSPAPAVT